MTANKAAEILQNEMEITLNRIQHNKSYLEGLKMGLQLINEIQKEADHEHNNNETERPETLQE